MMEYYEPDGCSHGISCGCGTPCPRAFIRAAGFAPHVFVKAVDFARALKHNKKHK